MRSHFCYALFLEIETFKNKESIVEYNKICFDTIGDYQMAKKKAKKKK